MLRALRIFLALAAMTAAAAGGAAQGVSISPILVEAPLEGGPSALRLTSAKEAPATYQVRVFEWSQEEGVDVLTPSEEVRLAPEIFSLAPGATQTVRMLTPGSENGRAWRIVVDELPTAKSNESGLNIRVRYVVPMFSAPEAEAGALSFGISETRDGQALFIDNPTGGYARLANMKLEDAALSRGLVYVLPNSRGHVAVVSGDLSGEALTFRMNGDVETRRLE